LTSVMSCGRKLHERNNIEDIVYFPFLPLKSIPKIAAPNMATTRSPTSARAYRIPKM
jgi:hypothetical protein